MSDSNQVARIALIGVGFAVGGPVGASLAMAAGSMLFPGEIPETFGPRVNDLRVASSAYGKDIAKNIGTFRQTGEVIWSTGLIEHANTESDGGKGGPTRTSTTYSYTSSFAVALCEGEVDSIKRIWADSILIYDKTTTATADQIQASNDLGVSIYLGSESQMPSSLMQLNLSTDTTNANRGLCYLTFDNLQLEKYGSRIPSISSEVYSSISILALSSVITKLCISSGLLVSDIDVSTLTQEVKGMESLNNSSPKTTLTSLLEAYNIVAYESDWVLHFKTRGLETPEAIIESELNASEPDLKNKASLLTTRSMEHLLPKRVEVVYYEEGTDYQQANQFAQRIST